MSLLKYAKGNNVEDVKRILNYIHQHYEEFDIDDITSISLVFLYIFNS